MEKFMKALKEGDEATCIHILETESIDVHKKDSEMEYREKQYLRQASSIVIASGKFYSNCFRYGNGKSGRIINSKRRKCE